MATGFPLYTYPTIPELSTLNHVVEEMNESVKQLVTLDTGCFNLLTSIDQKVTRIADVIAPIPNVPLPIPANLFPLVVTFGTQDHIINSDELIEATAPIVVTQSSGSSGILTMAISKITNQVYFNVLAVKDYPTFSILPTFPALDQFSVYYIFIPSSVDIQAIGVTFPNIGHIHQNIYAPTPLWSAFSFDRDTIYNWSNLKYSTNKFFPLSDNTTYQAGGNYYTAPDIMSLDEMLIVPPEGRHLVIPAGETLIITYLIISPTEVRFNTVLRHAGDGVDVVYICYNPGGVYTTYVKYVWAPVKIINALTPQLLSGAGLFKTQTVMNVFGSYVQPSTFGVLGTLITASPRFSKARFIDL